MSAVEFLEQVVDKASSLPDGFVEFLLDPATPGGPELCWRAAAREDLDVDLLRKLIAQGKTASRSALARLRPLARFADLRIQDGEDVPAVLLEAAAGLGVTSTDAYLGDFLKEFADLPSRPLVEDAVVSGAVPEAWLYGAVQAKWAPQRVLGRLSQLWDQDPSPARRGSLADWGAQVVRHWPAPEVSREHEEADPQLWSMIRDELFILELYSSKHFTCFGWTAPSPPSDCGVIKARSRGD